jgi:hypothetical protein
MTPVSYLFGAIFLSLALFCGNAAEPASDQEAQTERLAKEAQNPVANLISVPFQNNFNFGIGPSDATQWDLNVEPVIPISLNKDWNLITRTIVPIINQPSPGSVFPSAFGPSTSTMSLQSVKSSHAIGIPSAFGLGDINPTVFLSPAHPGKLIWGQLVEFAAPCFPYEHVVNLPNPLYADAVKLANCVESESLRS